MFTVYNEPYEPMDADNPPPYEPEDTCVNQDRHKNDNGGGHNHNMEFVFQSDPKAKSRADLAWAVVLHLHARDVSYLMRHGFFWDDSNVQKEKGYIKRQDATQPDMREAGWEWSRHYHLESLDGASRGSWSASLSVYTRMFSVLARFRLGDLSVDQIAKAFAWDVRGRLIYFFCAHAPRDCINAYYDDIPMVGWWPRASRDESGPRSSS